jgi:hypothetical protein
MALTKRYNESKLASKIKRIILSRNISHKEISSFTGFGRTSVNGQLNCGQRLQPKFVEKLEQLLSIKVDFENGEINCYEKLTNESEFK